MQTCNVLGTHFTSGVAQPPHNDNLRLMEDWMTPAEFMQWVRREQERLRRELEADPRLLTCPEHRLRREVKRAMERCCLWHYYGVR
jgi:hypothetical protein